LSSILKALKKLDEDSMARTRDAGAQGPGMTPVGRRRTGPGRLINRLLVIVPVMVLAAAAAWMLLNSKEKPVLPVKQEQPPAKAAAVPLPLPQQAPPPAEQLKKEVKKEAIKEPDRPPVKAEPVVKQASVVKVEKKDDPEEVVNEAAQPGLVLNGVLWSDKPGRSVALISDAYVKEGETIDGVLVVKIEKNSVTLQSGEKKWTLNVKK
jgi:hypothetical protein